MEYKMKKTMALGAVIMLCAVAIIGVGYAAFNGNARTYNENNSADTGYMTLTPKGANATEQWAAITSAPEQFFDTYVYGATTTTAYYFTSDTGASDIELTTTNSDVADAVTYHAKALGSKVLTIDNQTGAAVASVDFTMTPKDAVGNADYAYFVKVSYTGGADHYAMLTASGAKLFTVEPTGGITSTLEVTVTIYIGYAIDVYVPSDFIGPAKAPADKASGDLAAHVGGGNAPVGFTDLDIGFAIKPTA